jgi:hypothetical protein
LTGRLSFDKSAQGRNLPYLGDANHCYLTYLGPILQEGASTSNDRWARMSKTSRNLKQLLPELARQAHEEELSRALAVLAESFDDWRSGRIDSRELTGIVHKFHQRTAREISLRYETGDDRALVASAVATGVLDRQRLPDDLADDMERLIAFFEVAAAKDAPALWL